MSVNLEVDTHVVWKTVLLTEQHGLCANHTGKFTCSSRWLPFFGEVLEETEIESDLNCGVE